MKYWTRKEIRMKVNLEKLIEYLFYLLILLYFVGKLFKGISFLIDILFIVYLSLNKELAIQFFQKYKDLILSFIIYVSYMILQSLFVDYKLQALKSSSEIILYIILFFAALMIFDKEEKVKKLIYTSFIILSIISFDSLYQYFVGHDIFGKPMYGGGLRITAWNDMPKVSLMMGEFFGLVTASILLLKNNSKKIAIFIFIIILIVFLLSGNRSPILALLSVFIFVSLVSTYKKYMIGALLLFGLIFSLSFMNKKLNNTYTHLLNPTTNTATSNRFPIYLTGVELMKDNLLFGIGSHNYYYYHLEYAQKVDWEKYKQYYVKHYMTHAPTHVHSVALDMILSYGIVGMFIFFYVLYQIYRYFIKNNSIGWIASIGFLYCITPFQFGKNFTQGDWQFITYLGLIFLAVISNYSKLKVKDL